MADNEDDAWNPFEDPLGKDALKAVDQRLSATEWEALRSVNAGEPVRPVAIDRLVKLGLAERDFHSGDVRLTPLGQQALRSVPNDL